jgi:hypothetical protein
MTPDSCNSKAIVLFIIRQRFGKKFTAAMNNQATMKELLGNGVSCWVRPEAI